MNPKKRMNPDHKVNRLESRLLSMLRPGEMLRFVFLRMEDRRMAVSLEGSGADRSGLMQRISTILHTSRGEGYVFRDVGRFSSGNDGDVFNQSSESFVEIVPHIHTLRRLHRAPLGFTGSGDAVKSTDEELLRLPDFPINGGTCLVDYPAALLAESPAISGMQIEFTRVSLSESLARLTASALEEDIHLRREIHGAELPATARSSFLALWWSRRSGWVLRCRVALKRDQPIPTGTLEVLGRELFGAECRLVPETECPLEDSASLETSLGDAYPDGWQFPAILPPVEESGALTAERIHNRRMPALPTTGILAGIADGKEVRLPESARDRHVYIAGATGTGKSTLLHRLIKADLKRKEGLVLLDPHGDLYHEILRIIPRNRRCDVVTIDPTSGIGPVAFNVLDFPKDRFLTRRSEFLVGELIRFFREAWDCPEAFGPMFEIYFRNTLRLMIHQKTKLLTLMDFERVFTDREFRKELLAECTDKSACRFWTEVAEKTTGDVSLANFAPYITCKISTLTQSGFVSEMICQPKDELQLEERINRGGIILVNLNKGLLGANESRLLGVILTMQIFAAGLKRSTLPMRERRPVNIYIDEFQNFVSDNVASMLSEARKFGLRMNLANQTLGQLNTGRGRQNLLETILGNVGNMIVFRLGIPDAERLKPFLKPFTPEQIQDLPNFHALVRLLDDAGPIGPLIMKTLKV
jgi:hypothetical protein